MHCSIILWGSLLLGSYHSSVADTQSKAELGFNYDGSSCTEYDDDATYNIFTCGSYDTTACSLHCAEGTGCYHFCGTGGGPSDPTCADGSGAVCAAEAIADIGSTCLSIQSKSDGVVTYSWSDSDDGSSSPGTSDAVQSAATDADDNYGVTQMACDYHIYCKYYTTRAKTVIYTYAKELWSSHKWNTVYDVTGAGPMAMMLLNNITSLCELMYPDGVPSKTAMGVSMAAMEDRPVVNELSSGEQEKSNILRGATALLGSGSLLALTVMGRRLINKRKAVDGAAMDDRGAELEQQHIPQTDAYGSI